MTHACRSKGFSLAVGDDVVGSGQNLAGVMVTASPCVASCKKSTSLRIRPSCREPNTDGTGPCSLTYQILSTWRAVYKIRNTDDRLTLDCHASAPILGSSAQVQDIHVEQDRGIHHCADLDSECRSQHLFLLRCSGGCFALPELAALFF